MQNCMQQYVINLSVPSIISLKKSEKIVKELISEGLCMNINDSVVWIFLTISLYQIKQKLLIRNSFCFKISVYLARINFFTTKLPPTMHASHTRCIMLHFSVARLAVYRIVHCDIVFQSGIVNDCFVKICILHAQSFLVENCFSNDFSLCIQK